MIQPTKEHNQAAYWVSGAAASPKEHRPALEVVKAEPNLLIACDGYRLHVTGEAHTLTPGFYEIQDRKINATYLEPATKEINYPDWRKVLPSTPKASMGLNPAYLADALKALPKECSTIQLTIHQPSADTTILEIQSEEPARRFAIVMGRKTEGMTFFDPR